MLPRLHCSWFFGSDYSCIHFKQVKQNYDEIIIIITLVCVAWMFHKRSGQCDILSGYFQGYNIQNQVLNPSQKIISYLLALF